VNLHPLETPSFLGGRKKFFVRQRHFHNPTPRLAESGTTLRCTGLMPR
jgi:hypothetical protein